jgi:metal-responsive CopG/Arc/MetJ family transcriptional regulator
MVAISLQLPDDLVEETARLANRLGITHAQLIQQALQHELLDIQHEQQQRAMASSLRAMRDDRDYITEADSLDQQFAEPLADEPEAWWTGYSS